MVAVIVGSFLVGLGINGFLVPHHLIDGGVIGIALILHYFFGFQTGLSMLILSVPIFLYAWYYERSFFYSSVHGLLLTSLFMDWLNPLKEAFSLSILTSSLIGGVIIGMGIGLMLRYETSSGGTDMLAKIISKSSSLDIALAIIIIDTLIILASVFTLGVEIFLFSCVTIIIIGLTTSFMKVRE
ncbi:YitT family protein [Peribacillus muralis]|nr:YitT family protein [Peribacillus muralis]MCK2014702.1 YitT family protein [Peribacillus muralis]